MGGEIFPSSKELCEVVLELALAGGCGRGAVG